MKRVERREIQLFHDLRNRRHSELNEKPEESKKKIGNGSLPIEHMEEIIPVFNDNNNNNNNNNNNITFNSLNEIKLSFGVFVHFQQALI